MKGVGKEVGLGSGRSSVWAQQCRVQAHGSIGTCMAVQGCSVVAWWLAALGLLQSVSGCGLPWKGMPLQQRQTAAFAAETNSTPRNWSKKTFLEVSFGRPHQVIHIQWLCELDYSVSGLLLHMDVLSTGFLLRATAFPTESPKWNLSFSYWILGKWDRSHEGV